MSPTKSIAGHGPNVGHGWVKYVIIDGTGQELEPVVFSATISRASQSVAGSLTNTATVKIGGSRYWTGWDAQLSHTQLTMMGQDRLSDPVFLPALLSGAISRFGHLNGSSRGVCVNRRTSGQKVVKSSLMSDDTGTFGPIAEIRSRLSAYFDRPLSILETDIAIRAGYLIVAGQRRALPSGWDRPLISNGQLKAARLGAAWKSGGHLDAIVIGGGGAEDERLTAPTLAKFSHAVIADLPQTAIPRGYARLARRLAATLR